MKPNSKNIITRGILGFKKTLSLITRGFLDEFTVGAKLRRQRKIRGYAFNKFYFVKGEVFTKFELFLQILGMKQVFIEVQVLIKANKTLLLQNIYSLKGKLQKSLELSQEVVAKIGKNLRQDFILSGRKQLNYNSVSNLKGIKHLEFSQNNELIASKQFDILNTASIYGTRLINTCEEINIKGKRDICPILIALDIID